MGRYLRLADGIAALQQGTQDNAYMLDGIHTYSKKEVGLTPAYDINDKYDRRSALCGSADIAPAIAIGGQFEARGPWSAAMARLPAITTPPGDVPRAFWRIFVTDCVRFGDDWLATAAALGWSTHDILGCDPFKPHARLDHAGLCWFLDGRDLVAITADAATIRARSGGTLTYRRNRWTPGEVVLPWEVTR